MRTLLLGFLLLTASNAAAQQFKPVPYDTILLQYDSLGYFLQDVGRFEDHIFMVRAKDVDDSTSYVMRLMVYDTLGNLVFRSQALQLSRTHRLSFHKSPLFPEKTFVFGFNSLLKGLGSDVYLVENGEIRHLGLLNVGSYFPDDTPWDIMPHTEITIKGSDIHFSFTAEEIVFSPNDYRERVLSGRYVRYIATPTEWKEMIVLE